ncbi:glycosyltransferase family 2 protein [Cohnella thailandensis]|uniref:4,4'-diaponeurosporenoate glycosyltransferase n=2 Tax=Cohnella thailandensis TaxID=557557 RepID=A0A841SX74_9BACL|nr:glycosyltransferase family 2 protein [Cohnella thailandensis]
MEHDWLRRAYDAGAHSLSAQAESVKEDTPESDFTEAIRKAANEDWYRWYSAVGGVPRSVYPAASAKFVEGYAKRSGKYLGHLLTIPTVRTVAAIVTVMNEKGTIAGVIQQLERLPLHELIFVVNGSTDDSFEIIRNQSRAAILHYPHPLGHDVGRAIGAKFAESELLLFLDGDFAIPAENLIPFIQAIEQGMDIALNNIDPYIGLFHRRDSVTRAKEFLNRSLQRADLGSNSLTAVPHMMTKLAAERIGYSNLAVPPKAQAVAVEQRMKIGAPASIDVISANRLRDLNVGNGNKTARMIIGDHIEAIQLALKARGSRLTFPDGIRKRL